KFREGGSNAWRDRYAQPVAKSWNVLGHRKHRLTGNPDFDDATILDESVDRLSDIQPWRRSGDQLRTGEWPGRAQQVEDLFRRGHLPLGAQALQISLDAGNDSGIEQLLDAVLAEQLRQQGGIQRKRRRLSLRQRNVALVYERPHVAEEQRAGE